MTDRLEMIADLIKDGRGLIDVGTDHGYIPLAMAKRGYSGKIFASDINSGPLDAARRSAAASGFEDRIRFMLCDGLELCDPTLVDTIVIAGMGGDTICGILDRAEWCLNEQYALVLQPMTKAEVLRYWLVNNGFSITEERLVRDKGTIYQLIAARFGGSACLSDGELFTGSVSLLKNDPLFLEYISGQIKRFETSIHGMMNSTAEIDSAQFELLREIHDELCIVREKYEAELNNL